MLKAIIQKPDGITFLVRFEHNGKEYRTIATGNVRVRLGYGSTEICHELSSGREIIYHVDDVELVGRYNDAA